MFRFLPCRRSAFGSILRGTALAAIAVLAGSCATGAASGGPSYSATNFQRMNPEEPRDQARREALATADSQAREQIREQVYQMRLSDGRTLGDLSAIDPFVRAVVQDNLRSARTGDRTVTDEGLVSVTVTMDLAPLYQMVSEYPNHAVR
jgi:hypothetical protein